MLIAVVAEMYSASVVESATTFCCRDSQEMGVTPSLWKIPEIDFLLFELVKPAYLNVVNGTVRSL